MRYLKTNKATGWPEKEDFGVKLLRCLLFFVPEVNPGYNKKMHLIKEWWIEFDEEGLPGREIGVDVNGAPVLAGPSEKDYGFWCDTNMEYGDFEENQITQEDFETAWRRYWEK